MNSQPNISVENRLLAALPREEYERLASHNRIQSDELIMTQELIADMLGVRREGVTVAAGRLQDDGAISYARGHITVLDREKLEATVCECYRVVKDEFQRLLG